MTLLGFITLVWACMMHREIKSTRDAMLQDYRQVTNHTDHDSIFMPEFRVYEMRLRLTQHSKLGRFYFFVIFSFAIWNFFISEYKFLSWDFLGFEESKVRNECKAFNSVHEWVSSNYWMAAYLSTFGTMHLIMAVLVVVLLLWKLVLFVWAECCPLGKLKVTKAVIGADYDPIKPESGV